MTMRAIVVTDMDATRPKTLEFVELPSKCDEFDDFEVPDDFLSEATHGISLMSLNLIGPFSMNAEVFDTSNLMAIVKEQDQNLKFWQDTAV